MDTAKIHRQVVELLFIAIGVILMLLTRIPNTGFHDWSDVLVGVGTGIIAASFLALLETSFRAGIESMLHPDLQAISKNVLSASHRMVAQSKIYDAGLLDILPKRDLEHILSEIGTAKRIDMAFNTARSLIIDHSDQMKRQIVAGCKIRLLITNPENDYWDNDVVRNAQGPDINVGVDVDTIVKRIASWIKEWGGSRKSELGSLEVKMFRHVPTYSIVIVYDRDESIQRGICWITPYLPHENSSNAPTFVIRELIDDRSNAWHGNDLFSRYRKAFNSVWEHESSTTCSAISFPGAGLLDQAGGNSSARMT